VSTDLLSDLRSGAGLKNQKSPSEYTEIFGRRLPRTVKWLTILFCAVLTLAYTAAMVILNFSWYDDEGFMLFTLRQFDSGIPLYDGMYTEYGPFYYLAVTGLLSLAGLPITHDVIRLLTIAAWTGIALMAALCVWSWSRSLRWTVATLFGTAVILEPLRGEPGHPQLLIQFLLLSAFAAVSLKRYITLGGAFFFVGAVVAAVAMMKVNIGIFVSLSLVCLLTVPIASSPGRIRTLVRNTLIVGVILLPTVLMYRHFSEPLAVVQCAIYTFGIAAMIYAIRQSTAGNQTAPVWSGFGFLVVSVVTLAASMYAGISFTGLLNGVLLQPMEFSRAIPFQESPVLIVAVGLLACAWSAFALWQARSSDTILTRLRFPLASGLALLCTVSPGASLWLAAPILWSFIPRKLDDDRKFVGAFVAITATFGLLIAFPVNGTQSNLAACLVFLAAVGSLQSYRSDGVDPREIRESVVCATIVGVAFMSGLLHFAVNQTVPRVSSGLPDSASVMLPLEYAQTFHDINDRIVANCGTLVTIPGMNSFHLWSGVPRVNPKTLSSAMVLFDTSTQRELRNAFIASARPCVIYCPALEEWSARYRPRREDQPFLNMVRTELVVAYSRSGYEIRVPAGDAAVWQ
jgi:hypothetical protein